jgi:hypothetical protein
MLCLTAAAVLPCCRTVTAAPLAACPSLQVAEAMSFSIDTNDRASMLQVVGSCIGTKYTSRFGSLMAVSGGSAGSVGGWGRGAAAATPVCLYMYLAARRACGACRLPTGLVQVYGTDAPVQTGAVSLFVDILFVVHAVCRCLRGMRCRLRH